MSASPPPSSQALGGASVALSANDRRERNKAASAKYRAKKHYQSGEMRSQITTLQDHNNVLSRQLDECRAENASLKNLVEKLKGRLVAEKVLKRLREVGREKSKRRGSQSSTAAGKISADDLALLSDSETEDMVDAVEDEVVRVATVDLEEDLDQVIDEEEEEEDEDEEVKKIKASSRSMDKKLGGAGAGAKRRVVRTNMDDKEYRDA
ncbi:hypothetical protein BGX31_006511 [Mortierella sp. GBA43]|nr:hypothetical protein BGX31_006511 [Mortierella sp. GBA43]